MKKLPFLLLCAACVFLAGCNNKGNNEPTEPVVPAVETEADFILKYYTSDSLLQYADITIVDTLDSFTPYSNYTIALLDTLKADKEDWETAIRNALIATRPNGSQTYENTKVITLKLHLAKTNKPHAFRIVYTRNKVVDHSGEIDFMLGSSAWKIVSSIPRTQAIKALGHMGVEMAHFDTWFAKKTAISDCTLSFVY